MRFFAILLLTLCMHFSFAGDFSNANAIMQNAVRTRQLTAKALAQSKIDNENFDRLIASAKHHLDSLLKKITSMRELKNTAVEANSELAKSIEADVKNLNEISSYLDKFCIDILNSLPKQTAKKYSKLQGEFDNKTVVEKLRAVSALLEAMSEDDKAFVVGADGAVSTGLFVRAFGKSSGEISELTVEGKTK